MRFELSPSPLLAAAIVTAHAGAALAAWLVMPAVAGALLGLALIALGGAAAWSRALLRSSASVRAIQVGGAETRIELAGGESFQVRVAERRYVTRYVVVLPLSNTPRNRTLLVTADMLGAAEFRRLRLWALWNRLPSAA
ncbi:MAG TPA: protein YgfX [Burkholderiales bacterium]|nr:protein YgfX [Burkholderiales bacterium]